MIRLHIFKGYQFDVIQLDFTHRTQTQPDVGN